VKATILIAIVLTAAVAGLSRAAAATQSSTTVSSATSKLGRILADSRGRTLYLFENDKRGHSSCAGACATYWPPLLKKGALTAGTGVRAKLLGTTKRKNGTLQVTYAGHPLHDFGAGWYVLAPAGTKIESDRA